MYSKAAVFIILSIYCALASAQDNPDPVIATFYGKLKFDLQTLENTIGKEFKFFQLCSPDFDPEIKGDKLRFENASIFKLGHCPLTIEYLDNRVDALNIAFDRKSETRRAIQLLTRSYDKPDLMNDDDGIRYIWQSGTQYSIQLVVDDSGHSGYLEYRHLPSH